MTALLPSAPWNRRSTAFDRTEAILLQLRPTCEHCNTALPADSTLARICSYECTFCTGCVDNVLRNVCPNCGGGFAPRPIRPKFDRVGGNTLDAHPASTAVKHRPVDADVQSRLVMEVGHIAPELR